MAIDSFIIKYNQIRTFIQSTEDYIIYGAGSNGQKIADYLQNYSAKLIAFCDSDSKKHGTEFYGYPVLSPEQAVASNKMIIVASTWYPQIIAALRAAGATDILNLSLIGIAKQPFNSNIKKELLDIEQLLADEDSKAVFSNLITFLLDDSASALPLSDYPQYLHPKIEHIPHINMIDGGACLGESLDSFKDYFPNRINMLCFEPEHGNIHLLKNKINQMQLGGNVDVIEAGLWCEDTQLRFSSAAASGSNSNCNVDDNGDIVINTRSIDSICAELEFIPNLIKMDIEGAEVAALEGAKNIITTHKPTLAICLYHHLDDLWVIPQYIRSLRPDYKMSLGHHTKGWFETVLYCY
tara:strand:+ start:2228 stop:3283 length:1056 start_codon:yes stop_codon:yes gene_type:complete